MDKLKSLIPLDLLEVSALTQIYDNLKFNFLEKLVIMPDCHMGYTLPIGGVALLNGVISPSYVGYDIGCGMCNIITNLKYSELSSNDKWKILDDLYEKIPMLKSKKSVGYSSFESFINDKELDKKVNEKINNQHGTTGGGNHFIELGENLNGYLAITVHSGSRKPGWLVGDYYMKLSKIVDLHLPPDFLDLNSDYGKAYKEDMDFMLEYALSNRKVLIEKTLKIIGFDDNEIKRLLNEKLINENHNHAVVYEEGKILHRKGATPADKDQLGIIPGNMKDGVYITRGLGNDEYLSSSSHGAGRLKSRNQSKKDISMEELENDMKGKFVRLSEGVLDEAPGAYKNLDEVIAMQEGIVIETIDKISSDINIKDQTVKRKRK